MKKTLLAAFLIPMAITAQIGIGTVSPLGVLDIDSENTGLLIPRVTSIEDVTDGNGNTAVDGTVVYDESRDKTCFRIDGCWIGVGEDSGGNAKVAKINPFFGTVTHYLKASNTEGGDQFGRSLSISKDGNYLAVGAFWEDSNATGINGNQSNNSATAAGAVYVFRRSGSTWVQEAYIKASNAEITDQFGTVVALSDDGSRLAVAADNEDSGATGVNGNQSDNSAGSSGALYVFKRTGTTWAQEAYIKASNPNLADHMGNSSLAFSDDGSVLAAGAYREDSNATGVNGNQSNNTADDAGAVYVFSRSGTTWSQQAYIKASNTETEDYFGWEVALSGDGTRLAVWAAQEDSNATGINGNQSNNSASRAGAVYIFVNNAGSWSQEAYVKASNTGGADFFGGALSFNYDGSLLATSATGDDSPSTGINGSQTGGSLSDNYGSVYIFSRTGTTWSQEAYIKPSTVDVGDSFGSSLSLNADGTRLAVGASGEDSNATGLDGNQSNNSSANSGAVYIFGREDGTWFQESYIKASNTDGNDIFGICSLSSGCKMYLAVGASNEASNATGVDGNQSNNSASSAGAVYIIE